jgi:hypothetical protein
MRPWMIVSAVIGIIGAAVLYGIARHGEARLMVSITIVVATVILLILDDDWGRQEIGHPPSNDR